MQLRNKSGIKVSPPFTKLSPFPIPWPHEEPLFPTLRPLLLQLTCFVWILTSIQATRIHIPTLYTPRIHHTHTTLEFWECRWGRCIGSNRGTPDAVQWIYHWINLGIPSYLQCVSWCTTHKLIKHLVINTTYSILYTKNISIIIMIIIFICIELYTYINFIDIYLYKY